ncbi:HAD family phosphatase [bacterium]|nr:HAD family phosphatase [bacterium]
MQKENIKAILFDLDGTLFKSERYHLAAWNEALNKFNISIDPSLYPIYVGKSAEWIEEDIKKRFDADFKKGELIKEKNKIFVNLFGYTEWDTEGLMPFARKSVQFFYDNSFLLSICTSGSREETVMKLRNSDMEKYFNTIFTADDVKLCKPAPDIYLAAINHFQLEGYQCLAIEDTQSGVIAAKDAGAFCFAIPNEHSKKQDFSAADKVLESLNDLIQFFNSK